jgi:hypothetical protein
MPSPTAPRQARNVDVVSGARSADDPRLTRNGQQAMRSQLAGAGLAYDDQGALEINPATFSLYDVVVAQEEVSLADAARELALSGKGGHVVDSQTATTTISNTTTESTYYGFTVPADTLVENRKLYVRCFGRMENSTGGNVGFTLKVKLGSTVIWEGATGAIITTNAAQRMLDFELYLIAGASAMSQFLIGRVTVEQPTPAGTVTGLGGIAATPLVNGTIGRNGSAADMTVEQELTVTITPSSASAAHFYEMRAGFVVLY